MPSRPELRSRNFLPVLAALSLLLSATACTSSSSPATQPLNDIPDPVFTDPVAKINETADTDAFALKLYNQYVYQDPALGADPTVTSDIWMVYFAGGNGRGRALSFLDTTNWAGSGGDKAHPGRPAAKAIWIMGNGDWQYAAYRLTNESERWLDRANAEGWTPPLQNKVKLHGAEYTDPFPTTGDQWKAIWDNYSKAYASMAKLFHGTGRTVHARFFVWYYDRDGRTKVWAPKTKSVWVECETVKQLIAAGHVADMKCASAPYPDYDNPADWEDCPSNCQPP